MKRAKSYFYEILLGNKALKPTDWQTWLAIVRHHVGLHRGIQLELRQIGATLHYYLRSSKPLPLSLGSAQFLLSPLPSLEPLSASSKVGPLLNRAEENFVVLRRRLQRRQSELMAIKLEFYPGIELLGHATIYFRNLRHSSLQQRRLLFFNPLQILSIDFGQELDLCYKKIPKYLKIDKNLDLLQAKTSNAILQVDTFPYSQQQSFLGLDSYDFARHSLIIGGSGCGKSKFLALLIDRLAQQDTANTKVVVIDPHDRIKSDLQGINSQHIIDFRTLASSIDLFCNRVSDINASVELMLDLFRTLISDGYNGRMERVLRFGSYLLIAYGDFSFISLRKLLTDLEYRNNLVNKMESKVPTSVSHFFLTDFNELRIKSYDESIAPIIAFIDEMQMVPVFSEAAKLINLNTLVQQNFLSLFSLNSLSLGQTATRTIAGLLFQQLFLLAQSKPANQRLILIVDEVAVIESPILARFLSELRKYQTSIILAGQYFEQISPTLCSAILANVGNYYLFRTSKVDAKLFVENLEIKTHGSTDEAEKLLAGLKVQECLVRIAKGETFYPVMKAKTLNYEPTLGTSISQPTAQTFVEQPAIRSKQPTTHSKNEPTRVKNSSAPLENPGTRSKIESTRSEIPSTHSSSTPTFDFSDVSFDAIMQEVTTGIGEDYA